MNADAGPDQLPLCRSLNEPWASLGYHSSGTDTDRPSWSSTINARLVTRTFFAVAVSIAALEVLMPCLQEFGLVLLHETLDPIHFVRSEPIVVRPPDWRQPELGCLVLTSDMNVRWVVPIAREEETDTGHSAGL